MFCPRCRTEYIDGITLCADCGIPLVDALPSEEDALFMSPETGRLVPLFHTGDRYDFINAAEALKGAGIEFTPREAYSEGSDAGESSPLPCGWVVFVDESRVEAARGVLMGNDPGTMADEFFETYEGPVATEDRMAPPAGGVVRPAESGNAPGRMRIVEQGDSCRGRLLLFVLLVTVMTGIFLLFRQ